VGRRGRKRQLDLESEYWKLLRSGVARSPPEAAGHQPQDWLPLAGRERRSSRRAGWPSRPAPAATCPCWNDNGSPPCGTRAWRPRDRPPTGPLPVNDQPGAAPPSSSARSRHLRRRPGPYPRSRAIAAAATATAGPRAGAAPDRPGQARAGVESGADRGESARDLPRPPGMASVPRDHLPGFLPRRKDPCGNSQCAHRPCRLRGARSTSGHASRVASQLLPFPWPMRPGVRGSSQLRV
jgi:hypothetical protein